MNLVGFVSYIFFRTFNLLFYRYFETPQGMRVPLGNEFVIQSIIWTQYFGLPLWVAKLRRV